MVTSQGRRVLPEAETLFDVIWRQHELGLLPDGRSVLWMDRHIIHDASSPQAFSDLEARGLSVSYPNLTFATVDHIASTRTGRSDESVAGGAAMISALRSYCAIHDIQCFDLGDRQQGIVHVAFPEQGIVVPGSTLCCGDSHACTNGALGALGFAIGTSEITQALATQTVFRQKPPQMRISLSGRPGAQVHAKDVILYVIASLGEAGAKGHAVEFVGSYIESLQIESRFTICNMAAELGAFTALMAPDAKTLKYLHSVSSSPKSEAFAALKAAMTVLRSDPFAQFDREVHFDVSEIEPQISWGTSPCQSGSVGATEPKGPAARYMGIAEGNDVMGLPIDAVFIGSCTNGRLSDLRVVADIARGRKVANGVKAIVVPGSTSVRNEAEALGIADTLRQAGFEWREAGCSMCAALNDDRLEFGQRCVSTSNRNYEGRQGVGSRTHLASPATAAACAIAGRLIDPRELMS